MLKIINKFLIVVLMAASYSCSDDYLNTIPTDSVAPEIITSNPKNMMLAINGIHRTMYGQSQLGSTYAGEGYIMPMLDFSAGDILHTTTGNGWFLYNLRWLRHTSANSTDNGWVWYHYYHIIGSANNLINAAVGMAESDDLNNVLGQAHAYRAWAYHRLIRSYSKDYLYGSPETDAGVPLMLETTAPYEGKPRGNVKAVYDQIVLDAEASIKHLAKHTSAIDKSHITLSVAQGIAARVYLSIGDWANAEKYAALAKADYPVMSEEDYFSGFNSFTNKEWMWAGDVVSDQTNYYRAFFYYLGTNFNGSQNRSNPKIINKNLYTQISDTDYRKKLWLEKAPNRIDGLKKDDNYTDSKAFYAAADAIYAKYGFSSRWKTYPYMSVKFLNSNPGSIDPDDVLYMRASEMYLIEAEAAARGGDDAAGALALYNLVSKRDASYAKSTKTGDALLEEIKLHRRIELWGEGHRWFDMIRYDEALDLTGSGASKSVYQKGYTQAKPSENADWLYKIPQKEINANKSITEEDQNK